MPTRSLLSTAVPSVEVIYDFVSPGEESFLVAKVDEVGNKATSAPGEANKVGGWTHLNGRRSMYWAGGAIMGSALVARPAPSFMTTAWPRVFERIAETDIFDFCEGRGNAKGRGPNHCLVNEYLPGEGILPHTDGPAYAPLVATLSLNSHTILTLRPSPSFHSSPSSPDDEINIFLPARALSILSGELYSTYLHSIEARPVDSVEQLKACLNWEKYWTSGASGGDAEAEGEGGTIGEDARRREAEAKRRIVEDGKGWERARRISLTCRRVERVRNGIRLG